MTWDLSNLDFSAFRCPKLLNGGVQSLEIRGMGGKERDELVQADVAKRNGFQGVEGDGQCWSQKDGVEEKRLLERGLGGVRGKRRTQLSLAV